MNSHHHLLLRRRLFDLLSQFLRLFRRSFLPFSCLLCTLFELYLFSHSRARGLSFLCFLGVVHDDFPDLLWDVQVLLADLVPPQLLLLLNHHVVEHLEPHKHLLLFLLEELLSDDLKGLQIVVGLLGEGILVLCWLACDDASGVSFKFVLVLLEVFDLCVEILWVVGA
jgi:hypothetical protein